MLCRNADYFISSHVVRDGIVFGTDITSSSYFGCHRNTDIPGCCYIGRDRFYEKNVETLGEWRLKFSMLAFVEKWKSLPLYIEKML